MRGEIGAAHPGRQGGGGLEQIPPLFRDRRHLEESDRQAVSCGQPEILGKAGREGRGKKNAELKS